MCSGDGCALDYTEDQIEYLKNDLEQAREAIRYLRTIALEDHDRVRDLNYGNIARTCTDNCKPCAAQQWFDWNFNY